MMYSIIYDICEIYNVYMMYRHAVIIILLFRMMYKVDVFVHIIALLLFRSSDTQHSPRKKMEGDEMFQVILWSSIGLMVALFGAVVALMNLDPTTDALLYAGDPLKKGINFG